MFTLRAVPQCRRREIQRWFPRSPASDAAKASADAANLSAEAAKVSADAARRSADIDAALQRPYLGVSLSSGITTTTRTCGLFNSRRTKLRDACCARGKGRVRCRSRRARGFREGRGVHRTGNSPRERRLMVPYRSASTEPPAELLPKGEAVVAGHVMVSYSAPEGRAFTHRADFPYGRITQNFKPERAETTALNG